MLTAIEKTGLVSSTVTGRNEISSIRPGIADVDLYCMFGCFKMGDDGKLSIIQDKEGNAVGTEKDGDELERMFKSSGRKVSKFRNVEDKAEKARRIEEYAAKVAAGETLFE